MFRTGICTGGVGTVQAVSGADNCILFSVTASATSFLSTNVARQHLAKRKNCFQSKCLMTNVLNSNCRQILSKNSELKNDAVNLARLQYSLTGRTITREQPNETTDPANGKCKEDLFPLNEGHTLLGFPGKNCSAASMGRVGHETSSVLWRPDKKSEKVN